MGDDGEFNVPALLRSYSNTSAYTTGIIGKWHLMTSDDNGNNYGCETLEETPNATLWELCTAIVKTQGFDFVDAYYHSNIKSNPYFSHSPEWMVQKSQEFIDSAITNDQPFYLYFAATLTHTPSTMDSLVNFTAAHTPKGILTGDAAPNHTAIGMKTRDEIYNEAMKLQDNYSWGNTDLNLAAATIWIDDAFGAMINYLQTLNLFDNTFVVLMNDHGMGMKQSLYEQRIRIINSIRYPPKFSTTGYILPHDFIVTTYDYAPVVFDIAGVSDQDIPKKYQIDGKNWLEDVEDYIDDTNNEIVRDYDDEPPLCCQERIVSIENSHAIVSRDYKYIYRAVDNHQPKSTQSYPFADSLEQLYYLSVDTCEQKNLIRKNSTVATRDTLFEYRLKMWRFIKIASCLSEKFNLTNCAVPNINYIPDILNWVPSTAQC